MQERLSILTGQLIKETMDKRNFSYRPMSFFYPSLTISLSTESRLILEQWVTHKRRHRQKNWQT